MTSNTAGNNQPKMTENIIYKNTEINPFTDLELYDLMMDKAWDDIVKQYVKNRYAVLKVPSILLYKLRTILTRGELDNIKKNYVSKFSEIWLPTDSEEVTIYKKWYCILKYYFKTLDKNYYLKQITETKNKDRDSQSKIDAIRFHKYNAYHIRNESKNIECFYCSHISKRFSNTKGFKLHLKKIHGEWAKVNYEYWMTERITDNDIWKRIK